MSHSPIQRKQGEDAIDYKYRICRDREILGLDTWQSVADVINKEFQSDIGESAYRKWYANFSSGLEYGKSKIENDEMLQEIEDKTVELKKERIKLQSEKVEYNKMLREDSRSELLEEKIIEAIENRPNIRIPEIIIKPNNRKKDFLFPIADAHDGVEFVVRGWNDEILNQYNPQIFERRMWDLLEKFVLINDEQKINHVTLPNLGDSLDGILRMSQLMSLKMGVVDSAIHFGEFMSTWLNELSSYCVIDYHALYGNHNEIRHIGAKRGDFPHENSEKWISSLIKANLKNNKNITIHPCKYFMYVDILGTKVLGVHGQDEKNLENSIKDYMMTYNNRVDLLISGHLHSGHEKTIGMNGNRDIEFVQCPSIIGIDEYSLKLKKTANAGTKIMIIEENIGRVNTFNIKLN